MNWTIHYSDKARRDLDAISDYIMYTFRAPDTAIRQTMRIMKAIRSLETMPMRYRLCDIEPWRDRGLRFLPVDNYLVFYLADEDKNSVKVVRVIYGARDIKTQLDYIDE